MPTKTAVIGSGQAFPALLDSLKEEALAEICAVCDPQGDSPSFCGIPVYASPEALFTAVPAIETVVLASPDARAAYLSLGYGKHVLTPRPSALSPADLEKLVSRAVKKELLIARYEPGASLSELLAHIARGITPDDAYRAARTFYADCGFAEEDIPTLFI